MEKIMSKNRLIEDFIWNHTKGHYTIYHFIHYHWWKLNFSRFQCWLFGHDKEHIESSTSHFWHWWFCSRCHVFYMTKMIKNEKKYYLGKYGTSNGHIKLRESI